MTRDTTVIGTTARSHEAVRAPTRQKITGISLPPDLDDEVRGEVLLEIRSMSLVSAHSLSQKRAVVRVKWYVTCCTFACFDVYLMLQIGGENKVMALYSSIRKMVELPKYLTLTY